MKRENKGSPTPPAVRIPRRLRREVYQLFDDSDRFALSIMDTVAGLFEDASVGDALTKARLFRDPRPRKIPPQAWVYYLLVYTRLCGDVLILRRLESGDTTLLETETEEATADGRRADHEQQHDGSRAGAAGQCLGRPRNRGPGWPRGTLRGALVQV